MAGKIFQLSSSMNLLVFSGLSDHKLKNKLLPIISLEKVDKVYLIRNSAFKLQKIHSLTPPLLLNILFLREFIKLILGFYVLLFKEVDYVLGIFIRPHGILAYILGKTFKKPNIQLFIGNDIDFIENHPLLFKNLLQSAQKIGVRGTRSRKKIHNIAAKEVQTFIHHNLFQTPQVNPEFNSLPKSIDILCVADFTKVKRIDIFLKVIQRIKKTHPHIQAVMSGGNRRKQIYEKMKSKVGLENNVGFPGQVKDVDSYFYKSKIFLLTSQAEGLPMALIEAMSFGLPCVVPDVGNIADIIQSGYKGFLVKTLDVQEFTSRCLQLLEDEKLYERMSKNAIHSIQNKEKEFSLSHLKKVWNKILV